MKSFKQMISNQNVQLALISVIFLLTYLMFSTLFNSTGSDTYYREIIAALIGTILAAVITTMLLSSQTRGEELKERNVEVFRKKVDAYESFLDQALKFTEDWELSDEEVFALRRSLYRLSLFSSERTISTVTEFIRGQYMNDKDTGLEDVISAFRKELSLQNVSEVASWDMQGVETILRGADRKSFEAVRTRLKECRDSIEKKISDINPDLFRGFESSDIEGTGNGFSFSFTTASKISYVLSLDHSDDPNSPSFVWACIETSDLPRRIGENVVRAAVALGLQDNDDEATPLALHNPTLLLDLHPIASSGRSVDGQLIWTLDEFAGAVISIEREVLGSAGSGPKRHVP